MSITILASKTGINGQSVSLIRNGKKYAVVLTEWLDKEVPLSNFVWTANRVKAMTHKYNPNEKHPFRGWIHC